MKQTNLQSESTRQTDDLVQSFRDIHQEFVEKLNIILKTIRDMNAESYKRRFKSPQERETLINIIKKEKVDRIISLLKSHAYPKPAMREAGIPNYE